MDNENTNRMHKSLQDIFDEALELDNEVLEDLAVAAARTPFTDEIESDPTFYDEQVINVPVIENPGMKNVTAYPDTQIYDHLFSLDDEIILDEDKSDIVYVPEEDYIPTEDDVPDVIPSVSVQTKNGRKPAVRRAGEKKAELEELPSIEELLIEEETIAEKTVPAEETPIRKKPRVKRAGEKVAPAVSASLPKAAPVTKKAPARPVASSAADAKPAPAKAAPQRPAAGKAAPSRKAPSKPASAKAPVEKAVTAAKVDVEEEFDDTLDLITWEEGSSVKVAQKQAAAKKAERKAETRAFFDRFKKKLTEKLP